MDQGLYPHFILLNAGVARHHADWNWKNVYSPFARLYYVRKGRATILSVTKETPVTEGGLYFIPPFEQHGYSCAEYLELCYFHIYEHPAAGRRILEEYCFPRRAEPLPTDPGLIDRLLEINPGMELPGYDPSAYDNADNLLKLLRKNRERPFHTMMETTGILDQMVSRFFAGAKSKYDTVDDRVRAILHHIRTHIEEPVSLDRLAKISFLSKDHVIRLFRKELGITPAQYILNRKIERAQLLLVTTALPVKTIAQDLSFVNTSYFTRIFKRVTGKTPVEYRLGH